jgi:hypothetical protein
MKKTTKIMILALILSASSVSVCAQIRVLESFTASNPDWTVATSGASGVITDGYFNCTMAVQSNSKYRGDLLFSNNVEGNGIILDSDNDKYIAIKFIGQRPNGVLKFEMRRTDQTGGSGSRTDGYYNTWTGGNPASVTTSNGNYIYYYQLTTDGNYVSQTAGGKEMQILKFIIADAAVEPYEYKVDWVGTFSSLDDLNVHKDIADDGESDEDEPKVKSKVFPGNIEFTFSTNGDDENWRTGKHNNITSTWSVNSGGLTGDLVFQDASGTKYRADLMYNSADGTNTWGTAPNLLFNTTKDKYIAIKFIGDRPLPGTLKFEMKNSANVWLNSGGQYQTNGLSGNITTADGKIYYLDLSANVNFTGTTVVIAFVKFIIADITAPGSYTVDWIATFASVEEIETYKDTDDDTITGTAEGHKLLTNNFHFSSNNSVLTIYSSEAKTVDIFAVDGRIVRKDLQISEGTNVINFLNKGIYIIDRQKVVVK